MQIIDFQRTAVLVFLGDPINWFLDNRDNLKPPIINPRNKNFGRCGFYTITQDSGDTQGFVGCVSNSTLVENINKYLTKNKIGTCCNLYEAKCVQDENCFSPDINMEKVFNGI